MDKSEAINQKLEDIKKKRRENRKLRLTAPKWQGDSVSESELISYVLTKESEPSFPSSSIQPTFFNDPPPPPVLVRNLSCLKSLSILFPIGRTSESDEWFIISPFIHVPKIFDPVETWEKSSQRFISAITYSSRLLTMLSKVFHTALPYPIKFEENKITIFIKEQGYDLTALYPLYSIKRAVSLLNQNAATFGHGEENQLLPNLYYAMHPGSTDLPMIETVDELEEK